MTLLLRSRMNDFRNPYFHSIEDTNIHFTKHPDVEIQICEEILIPQFIIYISEVRRKNFAFLLKLVTLKIERERERERERENIATCRLIFIQPYILKNYL